MTELRDWLASHGLAEIEDLLDRERVDLDTLRTLTPEHLRELGLPLGLRAKLFSALHAEESRPEELQVAALKDGERRQVTALFCDIVGYTELANGLDPEALQSVVRRYEEVCAANVVRFEGHVFQLQGDGIVALFGYPLAHEGEAERAVHAGLGIIETFEGLKLPEVGQIRVRVGVASGLVVVSPGTRAVVGQALNLASRLQEQAEPGGIVVDDVVRRLAGGAFRYKSLGSLALKGFREPREAHAILGAQEQASRFEAATSGSLTPLVGRDEEIGVLMERWERAQAGAGQIVSLSGDAGIGKSRIASAVRAKLERQGVRTLFLQCSPYYANSFLWPVGKNLERTLSFRRDDAFETRLTRLESMMVGHHGRPIADVRFVAALLSLPHEDRYGPVAMTSQRFKEETLRALVDLIEAAARRQPTLLFMEDLHWADPTSQDLIVRLAERIAGMPLLVVLTHRTEFTPPWPDDDHATSLHVTRLARTQGTAILMRLTRGKVLPDRLFGRILDKADGVPLFVEELTKSILESGALVEETNRYVYSGDRTELTLPASLRDSLVARLDRVAAVKDVAQIGAAIGRSFSFDLVAALSSMSADPLRNALAQLTEAGLAKCRGAPPEAIYTFSHALVQDAAYDSMLKSRRRDLHQRIARLIEVRRPEIVRTEPEVLAFHLTAAGMTEEAVPLWHRAGEQALKRMALSEATSHLQKGLDIVAATPHSPTRDQHELALRRALGVTWMAEKGWPAAEAREILLPALKLIGPGTSSKDVLPVYWGLFSNTLSQGRVTEAASWGADLLTMGREAGNGDLLVTANLMMCVARFWQGELRECRAHAEEVRGLYDAEAHRHLADEINHDPLTGVGIYSAQVAWMLGNTDRAVAEVEAYEAHSRARGHVFDRGFALAAGADVFFYRGEPDAQRRRVLECERLGRENSLDVLWRMMAPLRLGAALILDGDPEGGVPLMREGLRLREAAGGFGGSNPFLKTVLAQGLAMQGDLSSALDIVERQIEQIERPGWGERCHYAEIRRIEGWLRERRGDSERAQACYRMALDWARIQGARSWELRAATSLALLLARLGRRDEGRAILEPLYLSFDEGDGTRDLTLAREAMDQLGCAA